MKTIIISFLAAAFVCGCSCKAAFGQNKEKPFGTAKTKVVELTVTGMTCQGCADHVTGALSKNEGIVKSDVKFAENSATVTYDPAKTNESEIIKTVNATGYKAQLKGKDEKKESKKIEGSAQVSGTVSFFEVPLVCAAAPKIGCGSKSKPVLLGLEKKANAVKEAWLNKSGTMIAVVWQDGASPELRRTSVETVFEENNMPVASLSGHDHKNMFESFGNQQNWYRTTDVDKLSIEEAGIIADRLVTRVNSKTPITKEKSEALKTEFTELFKNRFTQNYGSDINSNEQKVFDDNKKQLEDKLIEIGKKYLNESELTALQDAIALGLRPSEKEGKNSKSCCTPKKNS